MLLTNFGTIPSSGNALIPSGWQYGKEITISANSIDDDLTNFPVSVYLYDGVDVTITGTVSNVSQGKTAYLQGNASALAPALVDGNTSTDQWTSSNMNNDAAVVGLGYMTIDLGQVYAINQTKVWHYFADARTYYNTKTQGSVDGSVWVDIFNSATSGAYAENSAGKTTTLAKPILARYIRDYMQGSTANTGNHWVEVQVFGSTGYTTQPTGNFIFSRAKKDGSDIRFADKSLAPLKFEKKEYVTTIPPSYGDGSRNTVDGGYTGAIYNGESVVTPGSVAYMSGNYKHMDGYTLISRAKAAEYPSTVHLPLNNGTGGLYAISSTSNTLTPSPAIGINRQVQLRLCAGGYTGSVGINGFLLNFNGVQKSLAQAVTDGYIEPMVLIGSGSTGPYYWSNVLNIYNNTATGAGTYPSGTIVFTLKEYPLTSIILNTTNAFHTNDGVYLESWDRNGGFSVAPYRTVPSSYATFNVNIPLVSNLQDTKFYMFYGNPNAYNVSLESWQDQTGKQLNYIGNVKLTTQEVSDVSATPTQWVVPDGVTSTEVLVVAGGGGGGSSQSSLGGAGGGGAGGLVYNASYAVTPGSIISVTVGNGGTAGGTNSSQAGQNGGNSVFGTITAIGGGGGGNGSGSDPNGRSGGSGGGGGYNGYSTVRSGGAGTTGQGYAGGSTSNLSYAGGAGGGGAGGAGSPNQINHAGGPGGPGLSYNITGSSVVYAAGGKGGDGGAVGSASPANTGKGGDGAYASGVAYAGSSGIVILKYTKNSITYRTVFNGTSVATSTGRLASCAAFDGSGDYFSLGGQSDFAFGTGNFCVEVKYQPSVNGTTQTFYDSRPSSTNGAYVDFARLDTNKAAAYINSTIVITGTTDLLAGVTYDVALVRNNGVTKLYVNGVQEGASYTDNNNYLVGASRPVIGTNGYNTSGDYMNGYIYGMRVTKGRARYTANYTPPSSFEIDGNDVVFCTNFDNIYDSNYVSIYHLGTSLVDATGKNGVGTLTGTSVANSQYGKVRSFNGTSDRLLINGSSIPTGNELTFLCFINGDTKLPLSTSIIEAKAGTSVNSRTLNMHLPWVNEIVYLDCGGDGSTTYDRIYKTAVVSEYEGSWKVWHGTKNATAGLLKIYHEGALWHSGTGMTRTIPTTTYASLGAGFSDGSANATCFWPGLLSEVRLSRVARSDAWIKAETLDMKYGLVTMKDLT